MLYNICYVTSVMGEKLRNTCYGKKVMLRALWKECYVTSVRKGDVSLPPSRKISREAIMEACLKIVRGEGLENLNARRIAKELGCSTQPIFSHFANMDEIKDEVIKEISRYFDQAMLRGNYTKPVYKDIGINYIRFAKEEPVYFKLLFNREEALGVINFIELSGSSEEIFHTISKQTGMTNEQARQFHQRMWLYVNGIANLVANNTCTFSEDEIDNLLTQQYISMIMFEVYKGNVKQIVLDNVLAIQPKRKGEEENGKVN